MSLLTTAIDWMSKGLAVLTLLLCALWVAFQIFEGLVKATEFGAAFRHFIINRRAFERWQRELNDEVKP